MSASRTLKERLVQHERRALQPGPQGSRAAVALLIRSLPDDDLELLFIRRAEHPQDPWSGHMAFPGGRVDPEDADELAAAMRETHEELGVDLAATTSLIGRLDDLTAAARSKRIDLIISPFVFELHQPIALQPNHEVQEVHWLTLRELREPSAAGTLPYTWEGTLYQLPCLRVRERTIWGLTYMMLNSLLRVAGWVT